MRKHAFTGLLALLAVASLTWASTGFGASSHPNSTASAESAPAPDATLMAEARAHVGVLARSPRAGDDTVGQQTAGNPLFADAPVDLSTARLVRRGTLAIWLASSSDGRSVCAIGRGALACPPVAEIVARGLTPMLLHRVGEPFEVSGIATDDVRSVDVVKADGSVTTVPVTENLFSVEVPALPRALRWSGPTGPQSFSFPQHLGR